MWRDEYGRVWDEIPNKPSTSTPGSELLTLELRVILVDGTVRELNVLIQTARERYDNNPHRFNCCGYETMLLGKSHSQAFVELVKRAQNAPQNNVPDISHSSLRVSLEQLSSRIFLWVAIRLAERFHFQYTVCPIPILRERRLQFLQRQCLKQHYAE